MSDDATEVEEQVIPEKRKIRCQEVRASRMIALLKQMGIKSAEEMSLEDAAKSHRRMRRGVESCGQALPLAQIVARSSRRRRAKNTHRGKR
jgi:hypothetical protein